MPRCSKCGKWHYFRWTEGQEELCGIKLSRTCEREKEGGLEPELYPLTVDYSQSLAKMIAAGRYFWTNNNITARHFPIKGSGMMEIKAQLVHPNHKATTREVVAELHKCGLRQATLVELLAFGAKYPDLQRRFPIVALGSKWVDSHRDRFVPYLSRDSITRRLDLDWSPRGCKWDERYRFLAVCR